MRRFCTALAAVVLCLSTTAFAQNDDDDFDVRCRSSAMLESMELKCVSCGLQKYYYRGDDGEPVVPAEKYLALLAVSARSFRELNPGAAERATSRREAKTSQSIVRNEVAKQNMQQVVISQIQAYGFCEDSGHANWSKYRGFVTNDYDRSEKEIAKVAVAFGFKDSWTSTLPAYKKMRSLMDDSEYGMSSLEDKRRNFRERVANEDLFSKKDAGPGLKSCLMEAKGRTEANDQRAFNLCVTMAKNCGLDSGFCRRPGMNLSGPTPVPPPRSQQPRPLPPPPPAPTVR